MIPADPVMKRTKITGRLTNISAAEKSSPADSTACNHSYRNMLVSQNCTFSSGTGTQAFHIVAAVWINPFDVSWENEKWAAPAK